MESSQEEQNGTATTSTINEDVKNKSTDEKKEDSKEQNSPPPVENFCLSAAGLSNPAADTFPQNFYFNVNGKKYYCYSLYADFLSPRIAKLHQEEPNLDHFDIDLQDLDNGFDLAMKLMYGEEISPTPIQENFLHLLGEILENNELVEAFKLTDDAYQSSDALRILKSEDKFITPEQKDKLIESVAQNIYLLTADDLKDFDLPILVQIFNNPKLQIYTEEKFFQIITSLIELKGDSYKVLLSAVGFQNLSTESMNKFISLIKPTTDLTPELWSSLTQRLSLKVKERHIRERYIHKEIPLPYKGKAHDGVFTYLRKLAKNQNPVDAGLVNIVSGDTECSVETKKLLEYGTKARWYLAEKEDNTLTFDFKSGKFALGGYTITSGASSSYWEYPTSWTWEGSNDNQQWEQIDERTDNTDLGANEKTYTWTCPISNLFRYVRFRLRKVVRHGGLYCREFELFGAYKEPEMMN